MVSFGDVKDIATIIGSLGTGALAVIAIAAAFPKIQNGLIARLGKAFTRETNEAIARLEATVKENHIEGLQRFEANEKAIGDAKAEVVEVKADVQGVAETLDAVAAMGQHTRRTLNGHIRAGRHLPPPARGQSTA